MGVKLDSAVIAGAGGGTSTVAGRINPDFVARRAALNRRAGGESPVVGVLCG